jgi:hypothetical protein
MCAQAPNGSCDIDSLLLRKLAMHVSACLFVDEWKQRAATEQAAKWPSTHIVSRHPVSLHTTHSRIGASQRYGRKGSTREEAGVSIAHVIRRLFGSQINI